MRCMEKIFHVDKFQIFMHGRCGEILNFSTCGVIFMWKMSLHMKETEQQTLSLKDRVQHDTQGGKIKNLLQTYIPEHPLDIKLKTGYNSF